MASMTLDLDVLKDIPGYQPILKSVVKSLIQVLLEQLSEHTAEESLILTASVNDGSLSHLGSTLGKGFLDGREEIKSQFLGYCLKAQQRHISQSQERLSRPSILGMKSGNSLMQKRPKPYERPQKDQSYQDNSRTQRRRERSMDSGDHNNFHQDLLSSTPVSAQSNNSVEKGKSMPVFSSQEQYSEGDKTDTALLYPEMKRENTSESGPLADSLESLVKVEATSDSDVELTGVEDENSALDFSKTGYQAVGYLPEYGQPFMNESSSDLAGFFLNHSDNSSTGDREFKCDVCAKEFKSKQNLERHTRIHTGDKPFPCLYCERSFRMKHHLQGHIASTHPGCIANFLQLSGKL